MWINVVQLDGNSYGLEVNASDLISTVHGKYEAASGVGSGAYFLTYSGKRLTDTDIVSSIDISEGATLHVVPENSVEQTLPSPSLSPGREDVEQKIKKWKEIAKQANFDADMHILDPEVHNAWLGFLEKDVIENSEFYQCRGYYDLSDHDIQAPDSQSLLYEAMSDFMRRLLTLQFGDTSSEAEGISEVFSSLASLRKSYVTMSRVVAGFRHLRRAGFCGASFTILLRQPDTHVAKIIQVPEILLAQIQNGIQEALERILEHDILLDEAYVQILTHIEPPLCQFLDTLELSYDPGAARSSGWILELCALASVFLDLGLVCYTGSHGQRFDLDFLQNDISAITISATYPDSFSFDCRRSRLACLDNYLDKGPVWILSCSANAQGSFHQHNQSIERLSILTTIQNFADIWGPVWAVHTDQGAPDSVQYYQLARGVIYPESLVSDSVHNFTVRCHWTSSSDFERRREANLLPRGVCNSLATGALLLIGATFRENPTCRYTLNDFEHAYAHAMSPLGPTRPKIVLDTVSAGLSFTKVVGVSGQVVAKVTPGTLLKEAEISKWKCEPHVVAPVIFHQSHAVEVSHCTGNARRTQLRNLFLMGPMQALLERLHPNWSRKEWGVKFLRALQSPDPNDIHQFWNTYERKRREIAKMIVPVLEILSQTGTEGDLFNVAFFNNYQERYFSFQCRYNDWANILKDTTTHAVYAIINENCLEAYTYNHSTARCEDHNGFTVLYTHIGADLSLLSASLVDINACGHFFRVDQEQSSSKIKVLTSVPHFMSTLGSIRKRFQPNIVREVSPLIIKGSVGDVFIKASKVSSGGMVRQRLRR